MRWRRGKKKEGLKKKGEGGRGEREQRLRRKRDGDETG